ncbi:hypothetical protein M9H77_04165 [Catharanthus roseus]|uniref:Uncharacterized protein n=1 Tax=Catharanthus roseus TaxID=4058 RepID=A0ACC0CDJ2_CATRO|nr:hypothetical protein M9H77_04165 [Catharanthus roseus]
MEEVSAHVHPGPIVPDVLTRKYEHRSGLIWSGDYETCFTNRQCKCFGRNLFQCYSTAPRRQLCMTALGGTRQIGGVLVILQIWAWPRIPVLQPQLMTDVQADPLALLGAIWCTYFDCSQLSTHTLWRLHIRDCPALAIKVLSYPNDEYIRWYREITRLCIGNPANPDTRSVGYQPAVVDKRMMTSTLQKVNDMASMVIQEQPSSPSQMTIFAKKVQTIFWRCMVSIGSTLGCTPSPHDIQQTFPVQSSRCHPREPVPDWGARGVKRGARRLPSGGAHGGRPPAPPDLGRGHTDPGRGGEMGEGSVGRGLGDLGSSYQVELFDSLSHPPTSYVPPPPGLGISSFQSPHPLGIGSSSFQAPLAQRIVTSSSDSDKHNDEPTNVVTPEQQLGFGHRAVKKTIRFTPSDWP